MDSLNERSLPASHASRREAATRSGKPDCLGCVVLDAEGVVRRLDASFCNALGYTPERMLGTFLFSFIHARDLSPVLKGVVDIIQQRQESATWTFRFRAADGRWCWLRANAEHHTDAHLRGIALTLVDTSL